jgi:hypothetical protein
MLNQTSFCGFLLFMPYRILMFLVYVTLLTFSNIQAQDTSHLTVTWIENGDVLVWRTGDAAPSRYTSGSALQSVLSSDGQYIAFYSPAPSSLWLITPTDPNPIEIVPNKALASSDTQYLHIGNLQRGANNTFYFNTYLQPSHITMQTGDLWMVDAAAKSYKQILSSGQAGSFSVSPDGQHIAIMQSGAYNTAEGKISLVDQKGESRIDVLSFPAVSTASDYDFYPQINWLQDSSGLDVAIPDKDLVYHDDTALTSLWQISSDGAKTQRGMVQASFFGLPQWSSDGKYLAYLRHKGDITTNQFEMIIAGGDGSNPAVYASGRAGNIGLPQWLPDSDQFIYAQGEPGDYWLGQIGQPPQQFPTKIFAPQFVDANTYVFATASGDAFDLRFANLGETTSTLIATVHNTVPVFNAVSVP